MKKILTSVNIKIIIIVSAIFMLSIIFFTINNGERQNIDKKMLADTESSTTELLSYMVLDNTDTTSTNILVTVNSLDGIEYIETPDGNKMYADGTDKLAFDYTVSENLDYIFKVKENNKNEISKLINVNNQSTKETTLGIDTIFDISGYKVMNLQKKFNINNYDDIYYKIGENGTWIKGTEFTIVDYDVTQNNLINEDKTVTVFAKVVNTQTNHQVTVNKILNVDTTENSGSIESESLLKLLKENDLETGYYEVTVSDEKYNLKVYNMENSIEVTTNTSFGIEEDVGKSDSYANSMIVLKVNGDITIEEGVTLTSYANSDGYGGPKGMLIYCTGKLINNGTISMTARGAKAEGQNIYLWKNTDGSYEYVPAEGAEGGAGVKAPVNNKKPYTSRVLGKNGEAGTERKTGGGGSGTSYHNQYGLPYGTPGYTSGSGSKGTSYSGGTGGGGAHRTQYTKTGDAENGQENGGTGGNGSNSQGGAGNPGGSTNGINGTGGLLIIYSNNISGTGKIESNGSENQSSSQAPGGGSGAGSINIFTENISDEMQIDAEGKGNASGKGGNGSITIGSILTGIFEKKE